jgi:choice-of-anchor B domain-containing protein
MPRPDLTARALLVPLALLLAPLAFAHDDDGKVLDTLPPYRGAGWRPGAPFQALLGGNESFSSGGGGPTIEFPASGVTLLSWVTVGEMDASAASGCWGYVSPSGREYAMIGLSNGTAIVEISDPTYPQIIAKIPGSGSIWRDIKVYQHYAYIVTEGTDGGIQVIDMAQIDQGIATMVDHVLAGGSASTHTLALDPVSGYLYRAGGGGNGIRIYSLADPAHPAYVASWGTRYVHETQVVTYTSGPYAGRQIAFLCSGYNNGGSSTRFEILDVTDKSSMFVRGTVFYSNAKYSHQAWTEDKKYVYLDDEKDENGTLPTTTYVIDIQNLDAPFQLGSFTNGSQSIGHNLYVKGNLCYEANYRSGMRVFDVSSPTNVQEVAYFDTWPSDDINAFNGLWTCYPYFPSGAVLGSDREKGLFVWWVGAPLLDFSYPDGLPAFLDPAGSSVRVQIAEAHAGDLVAGTEEMRWSIDGDAFSSSQLVPLGGGTYRADFPALPCGRLARWYVAARSTNGFEWRSPVGSPNNSHATWIAFSSSLVVADDFESDAGWTRDPNDDAAKGLWERGVPQGSGEGAAPSLDHSETGTICWLTGAYSDVDGGTTSLLSPAFDLTDQVNPVISYWRWYAKDVGLFSSSDTFHVYVSGDGGSSWVEVEVLKGRTVETAGGWFEHSFNVADYVGLTNAVRLKVEVSDLNYDSTIEAALDDFRITDYHCDCNGNLIADDEDIASGAELDCNGNHVPDSCDIASGTSLDANGNGVPDECDCSSSNYCTAYANSAGPGAHIDRSGSTSIPANDFVLEVQGAVPSQFGLFFYGPEAIEVPFGDGVLCVGAGTSGLFRLLPPMPSDGAGNASRHLDFTQPPASDGDGKILSGSTWRFQYWYRDPAAGGTGFNLSDALAVMFCD